MINWKTRPIPIKSFLMGCIVTSGLSGVYFNRTHPRALMPPETIVELQCDKDTIIQAHYAEIIEEIMSNAERK